MALAVKTSLIPFDQGLNTFGNPHRQPEGIITNGNGIALDKDGCIYPGLQLSNYATPGGAIGPYVFNSGPYTTSATSTSDALLAHSSTANSSPTVNIATGANSLTSPPVYPFYQSTQTVYGPQNAFGVGSVKAICSAVSNGLICYAWLTPNGTPVFMREDLATGERESPIYFTASGAFNNINFGAGTFVSLKIAVAPNYSTQGVASGFVIFVVSQAVPAAKPITKIVLQGALGGFSVSFANLSGTTNCNNIDVSYDASQTYVVLNDNNTRIASFRSGTNYTFNSLVTTALTSNSPLSIASNQITETPSSVIVAWVTSGNVATLYTFNTSFSGSGTGTFTGSAALVRQISIGISGASYIVCFEYLYSPAAGITWNYVTTAQSAVGSIPSTILTTIKACGGVALTGKPWMNSLGVGDTASAHCLIPIRTGWNYSNGGPTSSQTAYPNGYLVDINGNVASKWADRDYGASNIWPNFDGAYTADVLPVLQQPIVYGPSNAQYAWPQLAYAEGLSTSQVSLGQPVNPLCSVCKVVFSPQLGTTNKFTQLGPNLLLPLSVNALHDGSSSFESGFFTSCPQPTVSSQNNGSLTPNVTYFYVGVMQYIDASGRTHYSAPSLPVLAPPVVSGGRANVITYPNIYLTLRNKSINTINFLTYRTLAGGSSGTSTGAAYFLVDSTIFNNNGDFTASILDTLSDSSIASAPKIYTSNYSAGASAGTAAPPPFFSTCVWQNCIWGAAYRNGWELWFTWPLDNSVFQPEGVTWSSVNRIAIPSDVGQVQGISSIDSSLVILGTNRDYIITGSPPIRSSSQLDSATFSSVAQLPTPSGMRVRNGVCTVPQGLILQGTTGMLLLDRAFNYNDIGNSISDIVGNTNYGAGVLYAQGNCVVFPVVSGSGPPLAYYYEDGRWSIPYQSTSGVSNWNQVVSLSPFRMGNSITNVGLTRNTSSPLIQLGPNSVYMQVQTPWVEMAKSAGPGQPAQNVSGYGRLFEVQVQGDLRSDISFPYTLALKTEYDYVNNVLNPPDTQTISVADSAMQAPGPADLAWRFGFTTCQAKRVRFTLTFDATAGNFTLPLSSPLVAFSGLMLYYGVDDGLARTGQALSSPIGS